MPDIGKELHGRRHKRIVFGELEFSGKDTAFVGSAFGSFNQCFPYEEVVFFDGAGGDAIGWVLSEMLVFLE
jgi:hypothetical protein